MRPGREGWTGSSHQHKGGDGNNHLPGKDSIDSHEEMNTPTQTGTGA